MRRRALERSYRRALYRVETGTGPVDLRVGEPAPELDRWLAAHGAVRWGFVTAVNPGSEPLPAPENAARMARLEARLRRDGRDFRPGLGLDPDGRWPPEPSFLVLGATEPELAALAAEFEQAAFLAGERGGAPRLVFVEDPAARPLRRRARTRSGAGR